MCAAQLRDMDYQYTTNISLLSFPRGNFIFRTVIKPLTLRNIFVHSILIQNSIAHLLPYAWEVYDLPTALELFSATTRNHHKHEQVGMIHQSISIEPNYVS